MRTMRFFPWNQSFIDFLPEDEWQRIVEAESELDDLLDAFMETHNLTHPISVGDQKASHADAFFKAIDSSPMPGHVKVVKGKGGRPTFRVVYRKDMPQLALYHWYFQQGHKTTEQFEAEQALVVAKKAYNKLLDEIARDNTEPCQYCSKPDDSCTCEYCEWCGEIFYRCYCDGEGNYDDEPTDPYEIGVPVPVTGGTGVEDE